MINTEQEKTQKNSWSAKLRRTFTSILPVDKKRQGQCKRCSACCKLPNICPFLRFDEQGLAQCGIYPIRPLNCRKYPRTESELLTSDSCGFTFTEELK